MYTLITFSIHASAKEATAQYLKSNYHIKIFNPRLREGGDQKDRLPVVFSDFSIHASAKEATQRHQLNRL